MTDEVVTNPKTQVATPGELAAAREGRGMSQVDISQRIKLQVKQVNALEEGQWDALPGKSFVRGALRSYGKLLDVDVGPLLESIGGFAEPAQVQSRRPLDSAISRSSGMGFDGGGRGSPILWVIAGLIGVVALVLYFGSDQDGSRIRSWLPSGKTPSGAASEPAPAAPPSAPAPATPAGSGSPSGAGPSSEPGASSRTGSSSGAAPSSGTGPASGLGPSSASAQAAASPGSGQAPSTLSSQSSPAQGSTSSSTSPPPGQPASASSAGAAAANGAGAAAGSGSVLNALSVLPRGGVAPAPATPAAPAASASSAPSAAGIAPGSAGGPAGGNSSAGAMAPGSPSHPGAEGGPARLQAAAALPAGSAPAVAAMTGVGSAAPPAALAPSNAAAAAAAGDAPKPVLAGAKGVVRFRAGKQDSWVEVRQADGTALHNGLVKSGDTLELSGKPPYRLVLGNASNLEVFYEGKTQDLAPHMRGNNIARLQLK